MGWGRRMLYKWWLGIIKTLGLFPWPVLFLFSDLLFVVIFYVIRYRKKIVRENLKKVFPHKTEAEIKTISRQYYHHLCDLIIETLKAFRMSDQELAERVVLKNTGLPEKIQESGKGVLVIGTHYGNNEWLTSRVDLMVGKLFPTYGVYNPFSNKIFDELMMTMRTRRGIQMIPMRKAMSRSVAYLREVCMIGFITDQTPRWGQQYYYTSFFGVPTAWYTSISKIALRTGVQVYVADVRKIGRGRYSLELIRLPVEDFLPESPENIQRFTDMQVEKLEEMIQDNPACWLWSHRRWKRPPQEGDSFSEKLAGLI
ncbi:MAG: hypothetical protein SF052_05040 [Bacteroidia bacterium]|nr:hypothetical protein [Bacteroidia bacterium]